MAATRLLDDDAPLRLRYITEVFREQASLRGQARQFTQAGLELIGEGGAAADAEVIAVLAESLEATGLTESSIGVGTVSVWQALIEKSGMGEEWAEDLLEAGHDRNLVKTAALADMEGVPPEVRDALIAVPAIRGADDALEECRRILGPAGVAGSLDALDEVWSLLDETIRSRVLLDFGVMRSFDYYTGMVLEVYAPGLGLPLGGGGRYDGLLGEFGAPAPAAGFAIGIERLHIALAAQGVRMQTGNVDVVVGGKPPEAFVAASELRRRGLKVVLAAGRDESGIKRLRQSLEATTALVAPISDERMERAIEEASAERTGSASDGGVR